MESRKSLCHYTEIIEHQYLILLYFLITHTLDILCFRQHQAIDYKDQ